MRRSPGTNRYSSKFTIKTIKHAARVLAWKGFRMARRCGLHFLEKGVTMNPDRYMEVLRNHCFPFMNRHGTDWLLQDSTPCYASKKTKAFIEEEGPDGI